MNIDRWSKVLILVVLPVVVLLFFVTAAGHFGYTPDDTYIYLQFAKNILHGGGFAFNAGEPTYGVTSPLWLLIITLGGRIGADLYIAAKGLDLVFACLAIMAFYFLAFEVIRDFAVALTATMAFSVNAWFLRWAGTGMETSLAVLLALVALRACLRNEYALAAVLAGLLTLVRPEAFVLVGLIVADVFINSNDRSKAWKTGGVLVAISAALIVPWLAYAAVTFGTIVPNTALAKAGFNLDPADGLSTIKQIASAFGTSDGIALLVLFASAGVLLVWRKRLPAASGGDESMGFYLIRQSFIGIAWLIAVPVVFLLTTVNVVSRYLLIVSPMIVLYAYFYLYHVISLSRWRRFTYGVVLALTALIMFQNQLFYRRIVGPGIEAFQQGMEVSLIPIGKWCKLHTPPQSTIFAQDIGAIGYYSDRKICDGLGLVSPALLRIAREGPGLRALMSQGLYRTACGADYVVYRSFEPEDLKDVGDLMPLFSKPFYRMGLSDERINYYTLYMVVDTVHSLRNR